MSEPTDRFTQGVLDAHEGGTVPLGGKTLYRFPWMGALAGVLMAVAGGALSVSSFLELRDHPDAPVVVQGPLDPSHLGQWTQCQWAEASCADPVVQTDTYHYRAVRQTAESVVWIASDGPVPCPGSMAGVLKPAKRTVLETLDASVPGAVHWVLWTHAGPSNAAGLVIGGAVFALLGLFVAFWFGAIGQRVRDRVRPGFSGGASQRELR